MSHDHSREIKDLSTRRLAMAVGVNLLLTVAQVVGGAVSGSLALMADALHNLNDAASLGIALVARRVSRRRADRRRTFGYARAEVIGALINLTTLIVVGLYLVYEAIVRFFGEHEPAGWTIVILAGVALVIDVITAWLTYSVSKGNMNIRAAFVHNVSDALASVGVMIAGATIILFRWFWMDLVVTLGISAYVLYQGFTMMPAAIRILMESAPRHIDFEELIETMLSVRQVADIHHVHLWQLSEHESALEAHIVIGRESAGHLERIKQDLKRLLDERFSIRHSTLEFEFGDEATSATHDAAVVPQH